MDNTNNSQNKPETPISLNRKSQDDSNTLLSVSAAARLLGVHPNTVRIWTESGILQSYRIGPRKDRRIPASVVKCMLESG